MSEKRKHRRVNLLYYLKVFDLTTGKHLGHLVEISSGGFKMLSKAPVNPGQELHCRIELPETVCGHDTFTAKLHCCWRQKDLNPDYFAAGFKFIGLSLEGIKIIRVLINIYELDNNLDNLAN